MNMIAMVKKVIVLKMMVRNHDWWSWLWQLIINDDDDVNGYLFLAWLQPALRPGSRHPSPAREVFSVDFFFFWGGGVGVVGFSSKFRIQSRMILVHSTKSQPSHTKRWQDSRISGISRIFSGFSRISWIPEFFPIFLKTSDPKQNDISKHCTKSQPPNLKRWKVIPSIGGSVRPSIRQSVHLTVSRSLNRGNHVKTA